MSIGRVSATVVRDLSQRAINNRFVSFNWPAAGGGQVQGLVRRSLLEPGSRNVAAILHIGGTRIYLPESDVTIGSSKTCDIRINDSRIDATHGLLAHILGEENYIFNVSNRGFVIRDDNGAMVTLEPNIEDNDHPLSDQETVFLPLSGRGENGNGRYLTMRLESRSRLSKDIPFLSSARLRIEEVGAPIDPEAVEGTIFSEAITVEELSDNYLAKLKGMEKKRIGHLKFSLSNKADGRYSNYGLLLFATAVAVAMPYLEVHQMLLLAMSYLFSLNAASSGDDVTRNQLAYRNLARRKEEKLLREAFVEVLRKLDTEEAAQVLDRLPRKGREKIQELLGNPARMRVAAVSEDRAVNDVDAELDAARVEEALLEMAHAEIEADLNGETRLG